MKTFDDDEKLVIQKIIEGKGFARNLINIVDSWHTLQGVRIRIYKSARRAEFLFSTATAEPTDREAQAGIELQRRLTELIIKYVTLFKYLEKEDLAVFFDPARSDEDIVTFGFGIDPAFTMAIEDQSVVDLLIKYVHKEIMPTPSLRRLVSNDYKTDEELRFRKEQIAAWTAIGLSLFLGVYGIIDNQSNSKDQTTYNQEVGKKLEEVLKEIKASRTEQTPLLKHLDVNMAEVNGNIKKLADNKHREKPSPGR